VTLLFLPARANLAVTELAEVFAAPAPTSERPPGTESADKILNWMRWGGGFAAVAGIMWCAYLFIFSSNRHQNDGVGSLGKVAIGMVLFGAASGIAGAFGL
jgi:hypothetical protein